MTRRSGGFRGAKPTWTTTSTSGIFGMEDVVDLKAAGQWPRGPVAPTSLAGTPGDQQVALTWVAPATTHGTITDYVVEYTPAAGSPTVVATGSTAASYTLTGLTNGTEYTVRVAGVNHTRGDWSSSVAVTPNSGPSDPDFANVSLLMHFDGSNGSTTFTDSSTNAETSTVYGSAQISTTQSKFGGASLQLGGTGDYLDGFAGVDLSSGSYTVEFWFYTAQDFSNDYTNVFGGGSQAFPNRWFFDVGASGGQLACRVIGPSNNPMQTYSGSYTLGTWAHVAFVNDASASTFSVYLNGSRIGQRATVNLPKYSTSQIGRNGGSYSNVGSYYVDDLRISAVARYSGTTFTPPTAAFPDQ